MSYPNNPPVPASITVDTTASINSGLVGFWPLTDGSGGVAVDLSTGGNDGTLTGGSWATSAIGTALEYDGTIVENVSCSSGYDFSTGTVSFWVYADSTTTGGIGLVGNGSGSDYDWMSYLTGNGTDLRFYKKNGSGASESSTTTTVAANQWNYVAMTKTGTSVVIYVNGVQSNTLTLVDSTIRNTLNFRINTVWSSASLVGLLQNVRVYNRALTATEVAELYSVPWTGTDYVAQNLTPDTPIAMGVDPNHSLSSGLVGYWPLSDGSGTTARNLIEEYDGTLNGTASFVDTDKGTVITLDGNSDYVTFGSPGETVGKFTSSSAVTASIDFKLNGIPAASSSYILGVVYLSAGQGVYTLLIGESSGTASIIGVVRSQQGDAYTPAEYVGLETGRWYNATVVGDLVAGAVKLYLNGKEVDSVTPTFGSTTFVDNNDQQNYDAIGARTFAGDRYFDGEVSNYRLYDRALSATEVEDLYNEPWAGVVTAKSAPPQYLTVDTADSINTGLQGFWPLSDGDGTTAVDLSGNGNNGTLNGGADWGSTSKGTSYQGDGVDGTSVSLPGSATSQPITISCWGRFTDTYAYFFDGPNATDRLALYRHNSQLSYFAGVSEVNIGTGYNDGEWHHFVIVYDGASSAAYVDGVFKVSGSAGTNQYNGLLVGSRYSNTGANSGNIQNLRVYDRALSASEISRLYQDPWAGTNRAIEPSPTAKDLDTSSSLTTNLVGWWPLTEFGPQDTLAYDISGNDYHGVANGGVQRQFTDTVRAASFDGVDDRLDLTTLGDYQAHSNPLTISMWCYLRDDSLQQYWFNKSDSDAMFFAWTDVTGSLEFKIRDLTVVGGTGKIYSGLATSILNRWAHLVFVSSGSDYTLASNLDVYLDGMVQTATSSTNGDGYTSGESSAGMLTLGGRYFDNNRNMDAMFQNVRVYSRALSAAEIQTLYDDPWVGLATDSLVYAYYSAAFLQRL